MSDLPLQEMLHKQEKESVFILLDGAIFPAMQSIYGYEPSPQVSPIYYGTRHEASLDVSPCLYKPSIKSKVWDHENDWRENGIVFVSAYSYFEVLEYLKSLISVRLPNDQMAYWRFYSPEWFSRVLSSMSNEEFSSFNGPVSQWAAYADGHWELYSSASHDFYKVKKEEGWFQLSENCINKMKSVKKRDFYIHLEEKIAKEINEKNIEGICREDVVSIVSMAESLGFKSNSEIEWFTIVSYKHPDLMKRTDIKGLIEDTGVAALERQFKVEEAIWGIKEEREV